MPALNPIENAWLGQVTGPIVEPDQRIVDPHHHLWHDFGLGTYLLPELWADTGAGHNVEKTVFVECESEYRTDGPEQRAAGL